VSVDAALSLATRAPAMRARGHRAASQRPPPPPGRRPRAAHAGAGASPPPPPDAPLDDPIAQAHRLRRARLELDAAAAALELKAATLPRAARREVRSALHGGLLPPPGRGKHAHLDVGEVPDRFAGLPEAVAALEAGGRLPPDPRVAGTTPEPGPSFRARADAGRAEYERLAATATPGAAEAAARALRRAAASSGLADTADVRPAPDLPPEVDAGGAVARRVAFLVRRALVDGDAAALAGRLAEAGLLAPRLVWRDDLAAGSDARGWVALWAALAAGGVRIDPGDGVWRTATPAGPGGATFEVCADAFLHVPLPPWFGAWAGLNGWARGAGEGAAPAPPAPPRPRPAHAMDALARQVLHGGPPSSAPRPGSSTLLRALRAAQAAAAAAAGFPAWPRRIGRPVRVLDDQAFTPERPAPAGWSEEGARVAAVEAAAAAARAPLAPPLASACTVLVDATDGWTLSAARVAGLGALAARTRAARPRAPTTPAPPRPPLAGLAAAYEMFGWSPSAAALAPTLAPVPGAPTRGPRALPPRATRKLPPPPIPPIVPGALFAHAARTEGDAWKSGRVATVALHLALTLTPARPGAGPVTVAMVSTRWLGVASIGPLDGVGAGALARRAAALDTAAGVVALGPRAAPARRPGWAVTEEVRSEG